MEVRHIDIIFHNPNNPIYCRLMDSNYCTCRCSVNWYPPRGDEDSVDGNDDENTMPMSLCHCTVVGLAPIYGYCAVKDFEWLYLEKDEKIIDQST